MKFQTFNFARQNAGKKQIEMLREQYAAIRDAALEAGIDDFDQRVRQMAKGPTKPSPQEYVQIARRVYDSAMRSGEGKVSRQSYGGHPRAVPSNKVLREQARDRKLGLDN